MIALVSHAWPTLYALRRTLQRYDRLRHRHWRWLGALSLSATYGVLVLLTSLCVATGLLHVQAPHDGHHHHAGSEAHHHLPPDAHHASRIVKKLKRIIFAAFTVSPLPAPHLAIRRPIAH